MKLRSQRANLKKDGRLLFKLYKECFNRPFDHPATTVKEAVAYLENFTAWIYYNGEKPIGFLTYRIQGKDKAELDTIAVIPKYQNQGVGKKIMHRFLKLAKGKNVHLVVHPKNTPALIFYLKYGFQIYGWKDNYYDDGEPRLLLEKR